MEPVRRTEDDWRAALSSLLDGEEPPVAVWELMAHLNTCAGCSGWLEEATRVNAGVRQLPLVNSGLQEQVVNQIDVQLCACGSGGACRCADCQCGPACTCR